MAKKEIDFSNSGLGDISEYLHNKSVADLSWLDINEEEYHKSEAIPEQNYDMIPELTQALMYDNPDSVPEMVIEKPYVMVSQRPLGRDGVPNKNTKNVDIKKRVSNYIISGFSPGDIKQKLLDEFGKDQLDMSINDISEVMSERGLIANVYIPAKYIDKCHQLNEKQKKFYATRCKRSLFVLSKPECSGCVKNRGNICSSFNKQVVDSVPYTKETLDLYSSGLAVENRFVQASNVRDTLQKSFLTQAYVKGEPIQKVTPYLSNERKVTQKDIDKFVASSKQSRLNPSVDPMPSPEYMKYSKLIMNGYFEDKDNSLDPIASHDNPEINKLASYNFILGYNIIDIDALGSCQKTINFLASKKDNFVPQYFVRRSLSCPNCKDVFDGACSRLASVGKIVHKFPHKIERSMLSHSINESNKRVGRPIIATTKQAIKAQCNMGDFHSALAIINSYNPKTVAEIPRVYAGSERLHILNSSVDNSPSNAIDPVEFKNFFGSAMNDGKSKHDIEKLLVDRYGHNALRTVSDIGKKVAYYSGVQGHYFIDPTVYKDYGRGCSIGSSKFKSKRSINNILAGSSCNGCKYQIASGLCSKYSKRLMSHIPNSVVSDYKKKVRSLPVVNHISTTNDIEKFNPENDELILDEPVKHDVSNIEFSNDELELV